MDASERYPERPSSLAPILAGIRREIGFVAILLLALFYVLNAWTPSHYEEAGHLLGFRGDGLIAGASDAIRSDEWAVATPNFQIAVANDLGPRNLLSPYKEELKAFTAFPSRDWGMAFKPSLWGFLVLDPAHAYSLHFAFLSTAFVVGFAVLLRQLGCTPGVALAVACTLFLSQFVQLWWTSSLATFSLAPWTLVAYLWRAPWFVRLPSLAYAVAAWLIGHLYPPTIIGAALAFGVLLAAFRRDALRPAVLLPSLAAAGAGIALAWLYFGDLIAIMQATVYPGSRVSDGGGVPYAWLGAHVFPYLTTDGFDPLPRWPANACEISVIGSFLPLAIVVFGDHRSSQQWVKAHPWTAAVWAMGLAFMLAWMLVPIPGRLAPLLNLVPPIRMLWGFGLLLTLGLGVFAAQIRWTISPLRVGVFLLLVAAGWALSKSEPWNGQTVLGEFDLVVAPIFGLVWVAGVLVRRPLAPQPLILAVVVLTAAGTFGRFNPVQSAEPIFERRETATLKTYRDYAAANPRGVVVVPGMHGALINGAGVPAINHTLMRPQVAFFRAAYPELGEAELNQVFNRYAHIAPSTVWRPTVVQADLIAAPPDPFAIPLPVAMTGEGTVAPSVTVERIEMTQLGPERWGAAVTGWVPWSGVGPQQKLLMRASGPMAGRIVKVSAFRLPRPDVVAAQNDPSLFAAGFVARVEIASAEPLTSLAPGALSFAAVGAQ